MHRSADHPTRARQRPRTRVLATLGLAMAIVAAGCSDDDDDEAATTSSAPSATTTTAADDEPTTTSVPTDPSGPTTTSGAPTVKALPAFETPTGNITCFMGADTGVDCEISESSFTPPPKEPSCDLDWGQRLSVGPVGTGFSCYGDTLRGDRQPVLAYGEASRVGSYECVSREDGLRCTNLDSGVGFVLSRARYEFF